MRPPDEKINNPGRWANDTEVVSYHVAWDFINQLREMATSLNPVQETILDSIEDDDPAKLTVESMIELVKAVGLKLALVVYDDGDPKWEHGPKFAGEFYAAWKKYEQEQEE